MRKKSAEDLREGDVEEEIERRPILGHFGAKHRAFPRVDEELRQLRRPEDHFGYELVVVPSFEDALVAVLFNVNLQACVLSHGFEVASRHDLSPVRHFFTGVTPDDVQKVTEPKLRVSPELRTVKV